MKTAITKYLISILILLAFSTCQKHEWDSPFDPECSKELFTPSNFTAEQVDNTIELNWDITNKDISGFKIERKVGTGTWEEDFASPTKNDIKWIDYNLTNEQEHQYKLYAIAGSNLSNAVTASETPTLINATITPLPANITTDITTATLVGTVNPNGLETTVTFLYKYNSQTKSLKDEIIQWYSVDYASTINGNEPVDVSVEISGLTPCENYQYKIVAKNAAGENESDISDFTTGCTITDERDNNSYAVVGIGEQIWMAENLAYLPKIYSSNNILSEEPRYYVYDYGEGRLDVEDAKKTDNYQIYGVLYNYEAAQTACPDGWHLPTDEEWKQLELFLGMDSKTAELTGLRGTEEGYKLKANYDWDEEGIGNDEYNFKALPGGILSVVEDKGFINIGSYCYFWTGTNYSDNWNWIRYLVFSESNICRAYLMSDFGLSIRCIKDQ